MDVDAAIKKIDNYLKSRDSGPLIVDVQNGDDLRTLKTRYPNGRLIPSEDEIICVRDGLPKTADLLYRLEKNTQNLFVDEISPFWFFLGNEEIKSNLSTLLSLDIDGHVVIYTYQCAKWLNELMRYDVRLANRICILDGETTSRPRLIFVSEDLPAIDDSDCFDGISSVAHLIEYGESEGEIRIKTKKKKASYPFALYDISEQNSAYDVLLVRDDATGRLDRSLAQEDDWRHILSDFRRYSNWEDLISNEIGSVRNLESVLTRNGSSNPHWLILYLVALKLYGPIGDRYLDKVVAATKSANEFIYNIYECIFEFDPDNANFRNMYDRRKDLIERLDPSITGSACVGFVNQSKSKGMEAIYYMTDASTREKEEIIRLVCTHDYGRDNLVSILRNVYPGLAEYLSPYRMGIEFLDNYFNDYKYQKVTNRIMPEFMEIVEEQARKRDYNSLLQPRSALVERIDRKDSQTYFVDAMGVEYLAYIMALCKKYSLYAKIQVCRCELPSLTFYNKDDFEKLFSEPRTIISVKELDELKHHGKYDYDYQKSRLPIHLIKELEIIEGLIQKISTCLNLGEYKKAILISDHGASRLAVIHESEDMHEMGTKGEHSGRCCPVNEMKDKPDTAIEEEGHWVLANYDRFKGGRAANVEVHGGASLEEVVVPIIQITKKSGDVIVRLMSVEKGAVSPNAIPEITRSYRRPAAVKIYVSQDLDSVSITIGGHRYDAEREDMHYHVVERMPDIKKAGMYNVDVYSEENLIAEGLQIKVKEEGLEERDLFS